MARQRILYFEFAIQIAMLISLLTDLFQLPEELSHSSQLLYGTLFIGLSSLKIYIEGSRIVLIIQTITHVFLMISKYFDHSSYILLTFVVVFMVISFGMMVAMPVFQLPNVTGLWAVGFMEFSLNGQDKVSVYYPVDRTQKLFIKNKYVNHIRQRAYAQQLADHFKSAFPFILPKLVINMILGQLYKTKMEVLQGAAIAPELNDIPVIIFSNGLGGLRDHYSYILRELASLGYIVFAVQADEEYHIFTDEEAKQFGDVTQYNEAGKIFCQKIHSRRNIQLQHRVKNIRLLIDKIKEQDYCKQLFKSDKLRIKNEIIGAGHSFGGCTVLQAAFEDPRLNGGIIMYDPYFLPLEQQFLQKDLKIPVFCINSETFKNRGFNETIERSTQIFKAQSWQLCIELKHSDHLSFTDMPFLLPGEMRVFTEANTYKHIERIAQLTLLTTKQFLQYKGKGNPKFVINKFESIESRKGGKDLSQYQVCYS